jgi:hypothetical protein
MRLVDCTLMFVLGGKRCWSEGPHDFKGER